MYNLHQECYLHWYNLLSIWAVLYTEVNGMANPEHLKILKQRMGVSNRWSKEHLRIRPDLVGAFLQYANLCSASSEAQGTGRREE
jgi:hypothetical protein